jgi:hypothetical protein
MTDADLDRRVKARPIEESDGVPHPLDRSLGQAHLARRYLLADVGDVVEVEGNAATLQRRDRQVRDPLKNVHIPLLIGLSPRWGRHAAGDSVLGNLAATVSRETPKGLARSG